MISQSLSLPCPLPSTGSETAQPFGSSRMSMRVAAGARHVGVRRLISLRADHIAHSPSRTLPITVQVSVSSSAMSSPVVSHTQRNTGAMDGASISEGQNAPRH